MIARLPADAGVSPFLWIVYSNLQSSFALSFAGRCCVGARATAQTSTPNVWCETRRHLLNGLIDSYLYHSGRIDTALAFEELRSRSLIKGAAKAADSASDATS